MRTVQIKNMSIDLVNYNTYLKRAEDYIKDDHYCVWAQLERRWRLYSWIRDDVPEALFEDEEFYEKIDSLLTEDFIAKGYVLTTLADIQIWVRGPNWKGQDNG